MNTRYDDLIDQALSAEDRQLLERHSEPGYLAQAMGLFNGPWTWVMWLVYLCSAAAFVGSIYTFWLMYATENSADAIKWGISAVLLFQFTLMGKNFMSQYLQGNRLLREFKRLELQLSFLRGKA